MSADAENKSVPDFIIILELVTAVASALWIGGERMSVSEMVGGALILTAAVIEARRVS